MTKILVFESEPAFAWELRTELGRLGCTVQIVDDGNAGLQIAASDRPDLILLSIELPRMNGFSVCNKLKKDAQLKDIPLIIMSSDSTEETFEQHRRLKTRAEDYLRKPVALGELVSHIRQLIPIAAALEPEAILIDEPIVFDDEVEDLAEPAEVAPGQPKKPAEADSEIDDFLGGAFDRLIGDEEPKAIPSVKKQQASLTPDPPTIPAPPPPAPPPPPIVLAPLPPPPPPPVARSVTPASAQAPTRAPSVPPPPPPPSRGVVSKGPVTARSAPPPATNSAELQEPTSSSDASVIEQLRIELARNREELGRNREEIGRLKLALDASRSNVQLLESRANEAPENGEEVVRLKHEVEELKAKLAVAAASAPAARAGASREFLELREALNKKDKELLSLRDELTSKDKELVQLRDSALALERDKADANDRATEVERASEELAKRLEKLKEDRYVLGMRAENFEVLTTKLESKLTAQAAETLARIERIEDASRAQIEEIQTRLLDETNAKDMALKALEEARQELRAAQGRAEQEKARLVDEVERLSAEHTATVAALVSKHASEIRALDEAHAEQVDAAHETEIAELRQQHTNELEELAATHAGDVEAIRQEMHQAIETLKAAHAAQLDAAMKSADERLAARNREFADEWVRGAAELEVLHTEALKQAERDAAERVRGEVVEHYEKTLRALEGKHATELETMRAERDRAIEERDAASRSAVQELDRYVIALGADLQDTRIKLEDTEEQRVLLSAEVVKLKGEVAAQGSASERLENELRAAKAELVTVGAEKDRFVAEAIASATRLAKLRSRWEQERLVLEHTREALAQAATRLQEIEAHPIDKE